MKLYVYSTGSRLIENLFVCKHCNTEVNGHDCFVEHLQIHTPEPTREYINSCWKYKHLLLQPGLGHIEINMSKACFKLLWEICLKDVAKIMGFRSLKALAACQSANDHHKSMQMLEIALFGISDELLPYVRDKMNKKETASVLDYFTWCSHTQNQNYNCLTDIVFNYLLSLHYFRAGVRRNNSNIIATSFNAFSPLFFGLNMINYQELHFRDSLMKLQCPASVKTFLESNESFSVSGHASKGEGGDFVLEAKNRRCKMWLPPGSPTEEQWLRVCRNLDRLEGVIWKYIALHFQQKNIAVFTMVLATVTNMRHPTKNGMLN